MKKYKGIPYSQYVDIHEDDAGSPVIRISSPGHNMQTDAACFEALALVIKAATGCPAVTVWFAPLPGWNGRLGQAADTVDTAGSPAPDGQQLPHYMRFLYRLWQFAGTYPWLKIAPECRPEVERFRQACTAGRDALVCNMPGSDSDYNPKKGIEHQYEKWFAGPGRAALNRAFARGFGAKETAPAVAQVYDQYPNGLFLGAVKRDNRVFPTGFFDLWGVTEENDLCLFELKKAEGNAKLGVLSELYFYAMYLRDFVCGGAARLPQPRGPVPYRGHDKMLAAAQGGGAAKIYAAFLVADGPKGLHPALQSGAVRDEVCRLLNENSLNIHYSFALYAPAEAAAGAAAMEREWAKSR